MPDQSDKMRPVFTCVICACTYMPPKTMRYDDLGQEASPLHCSETACVRAAAGIPGPVREFMSRRARAAAQPWMDKDLTALPERARRRSRPHIRPDGARTKHR